jgi:type III pantothenate kinase
MSKRVFLEFEKRWKFILFPMMTTFLSLMGETPQTLGIDRMVLAAEQLYSFRGKNRLVDAGTCVTFDFINE